MSSRLGIDNDPLVISRSDLSEDGQLDVLDVQIVANIVLMGQKLRAEHYFGLQLTAMLGTESEVCNIFKVQQNL